MWRERLNVKVSNGEIFLVMELQKRKLNRHMVTQEPFKFDGEKDGVEGTFIDIYYSHIPLAIYLDGWHVHGSVRRGKKDEAITKALEKRGIAVLRFEYKAPIRKKRLMEICDTIENVLKDGRMQ